MRAAHNPENMSEGVSDGSLPEQGIREVNPSTQQAFKVVIKTKKL